MKRSRTKIRATRGIKPGMVIRSAVAATTDGAAFRQVASVTRPTPWAERLITFTDGTSQLYSLGWEFQVARSKAIRNAAKTHARMVPSASLESALALFGAYARTAVAA